MATVKSVLINRLEDLFEEAGLMAGNEGAGVEEIAEKVFEMRKVSEEVQKEEW